MQACDKRLVIMLTDEQGSKIFNIHILFKYFLWYFLVFVVTLIFFALVSIRVFNNELDNLAMSNQMLVNEYDKMLISNNQLNELVSRRVEELELIGERVEYLEGMVGVPSDSANYENLSYGLQERIENVSLASIQKAFVMKFIPNGYPMDYYRRISDYFGYRLHPILRREHLHAGVDFSAEVGTPVYATADGVVEFARKDYNGGFGNLIKLDHSFGFRTFYAHLSNVLVARGDFVKKGQIIAYSGNSGLSTGAHLHYEIRFLGAYIDPKNFVEWNMKDFDLIFKKEKNIPWQSLLKIINTLMKEVEQPSLQVEQK
ncbi:peptidase M23 [Helicobacter enhydrae]|uniref:Peptidase M23 n=1 Tax=Helicobacter enhydrae TaxID=222136 RepID=A0A1B1U4R7_9HELI|nr:M23 family metallopeptidase [Helicobacter enhydrae]ANV97763.1 peptidase M23 [Helicobacter enhydrae]